MNLARLAPPNPPAMEIHTTVPAGHFVVPVVDCFQWPVLRPGEFAIADPRDRWPRHGHLFVIEYRPGRRQIVCTEMHHRDGRSDWYACDLLRPRSRAEVEQALREGLPMRCHDGACSAEVLAERIVGRIVGVLAPVSPSFTRPA